MKTAHNRQTSKWAEKMLRVLALASTLAAVVIAQPALAHTDECAAGETAIVGTDTCIADNLLEFGDWCENQNGVLSDHLRFPTNAPGKRCFITGDAVDGAGRADCAPFVWISNGTYVPPSEVVSVPFLNCWIANDATTSACPSGGSYSADSHSCVCPTGKAESDGVCRCTGGKLDEGDACVDSCTGDNLEEDGYCVASCSANNPLTENGACVASCSVAEENGACVSECSADNPLLENGNCVASCSANNPLTENGACVASCSVAEENGACVSECSADNPLLENGNCVASCSANNPLTENGACVASCSVAKENGACVSECSADNPLTENGACVSECTAPNEETGSDCKAPSTQVCAALTPAKFFDVGTTACVDFRSCDAPMVLDEATNTCTVPKLRIADTDTRGEANTATIAEDATTGTAIAGVTLVATDEGGNTVSSATWSLTDSNNPALFTINSTNGAITLATSGKPDYATTPTHSVTVTAAADGYERAELTLTINVLSAQACAALTPAQFFDETAAACVDIPVCAAPATLNPTMNVCECAAPMVLDEETNTCVSANINLRLRIFLEGPLR